MARTKQARNYSEWEREQAVALARELKSTRAASKRLTITYTTLLSWVHKAGGLEPVQVADGITADADAEEGAADVLVNQRYKVLPAPEEAVDYTFQVGGWRNFGAERKRIQSLISGWITQQEKAQSVAYLVLSDIQDALVNGYETENLKTLAVVLRSVGESGETAAKVHQTYVYGGAKNNPTQDNRSYTLQQVWANIHETRDKIRDGEQVTAVKRSVPQPPPGILFTPPPTTHTRTVDPIHDQ